jgi:CMP-N-acetylneuraminic acid synthetase
VRVLVVIPARQFSTGSPGKNRDHFASTLATAQAIANAGVIVSTDDPLLMACPNTHTIIRPPHLEDGPSGPVIAHALERTSLDPNDVVLILQPSSPSENRTAYCFAALLLLEQDPSISSVVSVVPWIGEPPQKAVYLQLGELVLPNPLRRQDCLPAYRREGTVYAVRFQYACRGNLYGPKAVPLLVTPRDSRTID